MHVQYWTGVTVAEGLVGDESLVCSPSHTRQGFHLLRATLSNHNRYRSMSGRIIFSTATPDMNMKIALRTLQLRGLDSYGKLHCC